MSFYENGATEVGRLFSVLSPSAIKQEKVEEVTNVNFNLSIGTAVPAGVRYHPLPSRIVEIYPEWRGYDFILVHGRYFVLRPHTHEIVYIIEG